MTASSLSPPTKHPFSTFLTSVDPSGIFPDAAADLPGILANAGYYFPYLEQEDIARIVSFVQNNGVVDPLNLVLWGAQDPAEILQFVRRLSGWRSTLFSSRFWGLAESEGSRQVVASVESLRWGREGFLVFTKIVDNWARHHVRVFKPVLASEEWGYVALVGAHTETLGFIKTPPFVWHRVSDWEVARDLFAESARIALGDNSFEPRAFPNEGRWQGHEFDGRVILIKIS